MATLDEMEYIVNTEIGCFDTRMPSNEFVCRDEPGFYDLGGMLVASCLTKVVFEHNDGTVEEIAPVVIESCMNPGKKEIVPITYWVEDGESTIIISNTYKSIPIYHTNDYMSVYTKPYEPKIEKHSCSECTNCGKC